MRMLTLAAILLVVLAKLSPGPTAKPRDWLILAVIIVLVLAGTLWGQLLPNYEHTGNRVNIHDSLKGHRVNFDPSLKGALCDLEFDQVAHLPKVPVKPFAHRTFHEKLTAALVNPHTSKFGELPDIEMELSANRVHFREKLSGHRVEYREKLSIVFPTPDE